MHTQCKAALTARQTAACFQTRSALKWAVLCASRGSSVQSTCCCQVLGASLVVLCICTSSAEEQQWPWKGKSSYLLVWPCCVIICELPAFRALSKIHWDCRNLLSFLKQVFSFPCACQVSLGRSNSAFQVPVCSCRSELRCVPGWLQHTVVGWPGGVKYRTVSGVQNQDKGMLHGQITLQLNLPAAWEIHALLRPSAGF